MQTIADVLNLEIKVVNSEQTVALGAAMFAATAAGIYDSTEKAQKALGKGFETSYRPRPVTVGVYQRLYKSYTALGRFLEENSETDQR